MKLVRWAMSAAVAVAASCGDPVQQQQQPAAAPAAGPARLRGTVRLAGGPPTLRPAGLSHCAECRSERNAPGTESGADGGIPYVVVSAVDAPEPAAVPEAEARVHELIAQGAWLAPAVTAVRRGDVVRFVSREVSCSRDVHAKPRRASVFNVRLHPGSTRDWRTTDVDDRWVPVNDDLMSRIEAWVFIADTPHATVSDADGRFVLDGLAPGRRRFRVERPPGKQWSGAPVEFEVDLAPGAEVVRDVVLPPRE